MRWKLRAILLLVSISSPGMLLDAQLFQLHADPVISFTVVPVASLGSPESLERIQGQVSVVQPGQQLALYSCTRGTWFVQPFVSHPFTAIKTDTTWRSSIHVGEQYAALLVGSRYVPAKKLQSLPARGDGVIAIAMATGTPYRPKIMRFSGYDWEVRQLTSNRGGKLNSYDSNNAWVDQDGFLHLRITRKNDAWVCAEVGLKPALGQGTYSFLVRDISKLDPAAAFTMFTFERVTRFGHEMDIEVSRWGNPDSQNGQFVVQPYYEPSNVTGFEVPTGKMEFSFRWETEKAMFRAASVRAGGSKRLVAEHSFTSGVPDPGGESIHIDLYAFGKARNPMQNPAEVIIESFTYAP